MTLQTITTQPGEREWYQHEEHANTAALIFNLHNNSGLEARVHVNGYSGDGGHNVSVSTVRKVDGERCVWTQIGWLAPEVEVPAG